MAILINGNGNPAIYAAQDADLIASLAGNTTGIAKVGNEFAYTAEDANTISVADGVIVTKEGRRIQLDAGENDTFTIPAGTAGVTNYYIIGYHLHENASGQQVADRFVQLMANATDTIQEDTFRGGASDVYVSLYRVQQDGVNLGTITLLLPKLTNISQINSDLHKGSVSVTGDGVETMAQLITRLEALVDFDKVNDKSYLKYGGMLLLPNNFGSNEVRFTSVGISGTSLYVRTIFVGTHGYKQSINGAAATDQSETVAADGIALELFY